MNSLDYDNEAVFRFINSPLVMKFLPLMLKDNAVIIILTIKTTRKVEEKRNREEENEHGSN